MRDAVEGDEVVLLGCRIENPLPEVMDPSRVVPRLDALALEPYLHEWRFNLVTGAVRERQDLVVRAHHASRRLAELGLATKHVLSPDWKRRAETASALIDDAEATLKYFRNEGNMVRLDPANRAYEPQRYSPAQIRIQGRLAGLLRRY